MKKLIFVLMVSSVFGLMAMETPPSSPPYQKRKIEVPKTPRPVKTQPIDPERMKRVQRSMHWANLKIEWMHKYGSLEGLETPYVTASEKGSKKEC